MTQDWIPISYENCDQVQGPFYHGTKANLAVGELLMPGFNSHFEKGRALKHVYFSGLLEPAIWGAELAMSLSGIVGRGYIYMLLSQPAHFRTIQILPTKDFPEIQQNPIERLIRSEL